MKERARFSSKKHNIPIYTLALVTKGQGVLHTYFGDFKVEKGDLFFLFPAKAYYIENCENLQYIYICFTGLRADSLISRLKIAFEAPVFHKFDFIENMWKETF